MLCGMRTAAPAALPLFRSEMQVRLLGLLLLQPERDWTLAGLAAALAAPASSVHRELGRAEAAGLVVRDDAARPHRFRAVAESPLYEPLRLLLERTVGVEEQLRVVLDRPDVEVALIHGSWAAGERRPDSDIDVLVVGTAALSALRRAVRPIAKGAARSIDLTVLSPAELRRMVRERSSFARQLLDGHELALVGDIDRMLEQ